MKRILIRIAIGALALMAALADAQTPTPLPIIGNLGTISGAPAPDSYVTLTLQNCTGGNPTITGFQGIVQTILQFVADVNGNVNGTVWPNDLITCSSTTGATVYARTVVVNDTPVGQTQCYQVLSTQGTWNLNTQQPVSCTGGLPNPQDASYRNVNSSGFFQGVNGDMTGTWTADGFYDASLNSGQIGDCITVGSLAFLGYHYVAVPCPSATGVTQIIAGTNVTISPSGGTGAVTINATGAGSGTVANCATGNAPAFYPSTGTTVNCETAVPISQGGTGASTAGAALTNLGAQSYAGGTGLVYSLSPTTSRLATITDLVSILGYTPLHPADNLTDVGNALSALSNLFSGAGMQSSEMVGVNSSGVPVPVVIGNGLTYTPSSGAGSVTSVQIISSGAPLSGGCPGISFSGGGGSGAAAYAICGGLPGYQGVVQIILTAGGSGYTSAPTVVFSPSGPTAISAIGSSAALAISAPLNVQITTGTTAIPANSCTSNTATSMPGLTAAMAIIPPTPTSSTTGVTGWGSSGGLGFTYYVAANTFNWSVCNVTGASITPGGSVTWNVGAR